MVPGADFVGFVGGVEFGELGRALVEEMGLFLGGEGLEDGEVVV